MRAAASPSRLRRLVHLDPGPLYNYRRKVPALSSQLGAGPLLFFSGSPFLFRLARPAATRSRPPFELARRVLVVVGAVHVDLGHVSVEVVVVEGHHLEVVLERGHLLRQGGVAGVLSGVASWCRQQIIPQPATCYAILYYTIILYCHTLLLTSIHAWCIVNPIRKREEFYYYTCLLL